MGRIGNGDPSSIPPAEWNVINCNSLRSRRKTCFLRPHEKLLEARGARKPPAHGRPHAWAPGRRTPAPARARSRGCPRPGGRGPRFRGGAHRARHGAASRRPRRPVVRRMPSLRFTPLSRRSCLDGERQGRADLLRPLSPSPARGLSGELARPRRGCRGRSLPDLRVVPRQPHGAAGRPGCRERLRETDLPDLRALPRRPRFAPSHHPALGCGGGVRSDVPRHCTLPRHVGCRGLPGVPWRSPDPPRE